MADLHEFFQRHVRPGTVLTFVGAGGKSTGMLAAAAFCAAAGIRVRMTTTTRVGMDEFSGVPMLLARTGEELARALRAHEPSLLIAAAALPREGKYRGLDERLIDTAFIPGDMVLLVEGDGSRRRPLKVPTAREPVIPGSTRTVLALMGASGFDETIDEIHCYNHAAALALLGRVGGRFDAVSIAGIGSSPEGCRKGVLPGMDFHLVMNQGDLEEKRCTAVAALRLLKAAYGIAGTLLSWRKETVYETTAT